MNTAIRYFQGIVLLLGLATSVFALGANSGDYSGGDLRVINHTKQGIISFKVNGYGAVLAVIPVVFFFQKNGMQTCKPTWNGFLIQILMKK